MRALSAIALLLTGGPLLSQSIQHHAAVDEHLHQLIAHAQSAGDPNHAGHTYRLKATVTTFGSDGKTFSKQSLVEEWSSTDDFRIELHDGPFKQNIVRSTAGWFTEGDVGKVSPFLKEMALTLSDPLAIMVEAPASNVLPGSSVNAAEPLDCLLVDNTVRPHQLDIHKLCFSRNTGLLRLHSDSGDFARAFNRFQPFAGHAFPRSIDLAFRQKLIAQVAVDSIEELESNSLPIETSRLQSMPHLASPRTLDGQQVSATDPKSLLPHSMCNDAMRRPGSAWIHLLITPEGKVTSSDTFVASEARFRPPTEFYGKNLTFAPFMREGHAIPVEGAVYVTFTCSE